MKLLRLQIHSDFRSLNAGFELQFRDVSNIEDMEAFRPFCFAGLNGSGKSNVLEALANIFYHLDLCASRFKPKAFESFFDPSINVNGPNAFELEYMVFPKSDKENLDGYNLVRVVKQKDSEPKMYQVYHSLAQPENNQDIELGQIQIIAAKDQKQAANGKAFLPELVVGYSSGENEILSLPFIKTRLINYDEYLNATLDGYKNYDAPEKILMLLDNEMTQALLLCLLIFNDFPEENEALDEDNYLLKPLRSLLKIKNINRFRINLNYQELQRGYRREIKKGETIPSLELLRDKIEFLKSCATSSFKWVNKYGEYQEILDFYVTKSTKKAFRSQFYSAFDLLRLFQTLNSLNYFLNKEEVKGEVYKSDGYYSDSKLSKPEPDDKVFYFIDYYLEKINSDLMSTKELLLRNLSDGEYQFLHTLSICLMSKEKRTLLLLDEPETHFNPDWRSKFISILNESVKAGEGDNLLKDVILTSHSPFIISDCLPNNVFLFKKSEDTNTVSVMSAKEMDFKTYGTSVEIILEELFDYDQSIGDLSYSELKIDFDQIKSKNDVQRIKRELRHLGDSIEKDILYSKLNSMFPDDEGSPTSQNDDPTPNPSSGNPTDIIKQVQNPVSKLLGAIENAASKKRYQ